MFKKLVSFAMFCVIAPAAFAVSFPLANHPDGNQSARGAYGIRLDTFSVIDPGTLNPEGMLIDVTGLTLNLTGTGAGGATITGTGHDQFGTAYTINQTFNVNFANLATGEFTATSGTLEISGGTLVGTQSLGMNLNGQNLAFLLLNDGHRLPGSSGLVGRGWINGASGTNDWLVQAVPLPAAAWLFLSAIGGLVALRRKQQKVALA